MEINVVVAGRPAMIQSALLKYVSVQVNDVYQKQWGGKDRSTWIQSRDVAGAARTVGIAGVGTAGTLKVLADISIRRRSVSRL